jgi:hypothetical protein
VNFFVHKLLLGGERKHSTTAEARDATSMLRQMISEGRVSRSKSSFEDPRWHKWVGKTFHRNGPICFAESTTSHCIFQEDLSRMLQVYANDSEEQSGKVLDQMISKYDRHAPTTDVQGIIARHHKFQKYLQSQPRCRVDIPYIKYVRSQYPTAKLECRRAFRQFLSVLETLVVLQQHRRQEDKGFRIATLEDYELARSLMLGPLEAALGIAKDHKNAKKLRAVIKKNIFTRPEVTEALGHKNEMATSKFLKPLLKAGAIHRLQVGVRGSPGSYCFAEDANVRVVLPTTEEVEANS